MKTIQIYFFTYFQAWKHDNKDLIVELENLSYESKNHR